MTEFPHPFDRAIALEPQGSDRFIGRTSDDYWNAISPYGGVTVATVLEAVMRHPDRIGDPIAMTANFAGPIQAGELIVRASPARTGRSTQHWQIELTQAGDPQPLVTATAVFAIRRKTWGDTESKMPKVPRPEAFQRYPLAMAFPFLERYDFRYVDSSPFAGTEESVTQCWVGDVPSRRLDFPAIAAYCDSFIPRLFVRKGLASQISTVSLSINFHIDTASLSAVQGTFAFGQARANGFNNGFYDQEGKLWSEDGLLLAATHQMVWFKD
jgi:acyl-CoA thioesterase